MTINDDKNMITKSELIEKISLKQNPHLNFIAQRDDFCRVNIFICPIHFRNMN